jgi:hypothetical protein
MRPWARSNAFGKHSVRVAKVDRQSTSGQVRNFSNSKKRVVTVCLVVPWMYDQMGT